MKVFISHKKEDSETAQKINLSLIIKGVDTYLDVLDGAITSNGKVLTDHIKKELKDCTDILVVMSESTKYSQWVPFEVGMSAQIDMPTVTYLQENVTLPDFLSYWPRLKKISDLDFYIEARQKATKTMRTLYESRDIASHRGTETSLFYSELKNRLGQR